jgi:hypothetical protein
MIPVVPFLTCEIGKNCGSFSSEATGASKEKPGKGPGLPNLRSRKEVSLHAYLVAETRHEVHDVEDEANVP